MAPLSKVKCEDKSSKSELKGVQNSSIKGRSKQHDFALNVAKQVKNKVEGSENVQFPV